MRKNNNYDRSKKDKNNVRHLSSMPTEKDFTMNFRKPIHLELRNKEQEDAYDVMKRNTVSFIIGEVGSGKTYLACHHALEKLRCGTIKKIILLRPMAVEETEYMGFLKGTLEDKVSPYMQSMIQPMKEMLGKDSIERMIEAEIIQPFALAYTQGLTYKDSIVLVDEIQNMTSSTMRNILTRIDDTSKMILMGDDKQKCLPNKYKSAIDDLHLFENSKNIGIAYINEIVRGEITREVFECYEGKYYIV